MQSVIGMMSGTSMDGVDAAVLFTDGKEIGGFGPTVFRPYDDEERAVLRAALADARKSGRPHRRGRARSPRRSASSPRPMARRRRRLRTAHPGLAVDLVGFHGQTVLHAPDRHLTVQIGDGRALAGRLGLPVVYDFRAADVAAGGEGAPFVPVYHQALVRRAGLGGDVVVVNIGGVANITRIGADGSLAAGDTGPGNALIDDFVRARTGLAMDEGGALAASGSVDELALSALMADPWFEEPLPKSLDRDAFSPNPVQLLSTEDGAATLAAFTANAIAGAIANAGGADTIVISGGGAHNPVIVGMIATATGATVRRATDLGWDGDFVEAQAFAYLAARNLAGLPLSFPETTGVPRPMPGGVLVRPGRNG